MNNGHYRGVRPMVWVMSIMLSVLASQAVAQDGQCIFSGTVRIDGAVPSAVTDTPVVQLLKGCEFCRIWSVVRTAFYEPGSGTYAVSAYVRDGFNDSDAVVFRIIYGGDSIIARARGDAAIFIGTAFPNPPGPGSLRTVNLSNNHPPLAFDLLMPADEDSTIVVNTIAFTWGSSSDADVGDVLTYSLHVTGPGVDTTVTGIADTTATVRFPGLQSNSTYSWSVSVTDGMATAASLEVFTFTTQTVTGVRDTPKRGEYALHQNYPNPFNPTTDFGYRIADFGFVSLKVYDVLGREVATLVNEVKQPGAYSVRWNASGYPSGVYLYRLSAVGSNGAAQNFQSVKKLMLVK
jgi:hypothetical protein